MARFTDKQHAKYASLKAGQRTLAKTLWSMAGWPEKEQEARGVRNRNIF
jgi:hypothetical protein